MQTGSNSCDFQELSLIQTKKFLVCERYFLEDYFLDYFEQNKVEYIETEKSLLVEESTVPRGLLQSLIIKAFNFENWYQELKSYTFKSVILRKDAFTESLFNNVLRDLGWTSCFIKTSMFSPKDLKNPPVVSTGEEALYLLENSNRTRNCTGDYVILREVDEEILRGECYEFRLFVRHSKLTAISQNDTAFFDLEEDRVLFAIKMFFSHLLFHLPYQDSVIDIALNSKCAIKVIELTPFGADLFCWKEDYFVLHGGRELEMRVNK